MTGNPEVMAAEKSSRIRQLIAFSSCFIRRPGWRKPDCWLADQRKQAERRGVTLTLRTCLRFGLTTKTSELAGISRDFRGRTARISLHFRLCGGEKDIRTISTGLKVQEPTFPSITGNQSFQRIPRLSACRPVM